MNGILGSWVPSPANPDGPRTPVSDQRTYHDDDARRERRERAKARARKQGGRA